MYLSNFAHRQVIYVVSPCVTGSVADKLTSSLRGCKMGNQFWGAWGKGLPLIGVQAVIFGVVVGMLKADGLPPAVGAAMGYFLVSTVFRAFDLRASHKRKAR